MSAARNHALERAAAQMRDAAATESDRANADRVFALALGLVYQRPQHLLSRLARRYRILLFEEPVRGNLTPFFERLSPAANVEVLRPHTTVSAPGFHDDQLPELRSLLAECLNDFRITDYLVWQ